MWAFLPDLLFVLIAFATAYFISRLLIIESAVVCVAITLSSVLALASFEMVTSAYVSNFYNSADIGLTQYFWSIAIVVIFAISCVLLTRGFLGVIGQAQQLSRGVEWAGSWLFGGLAGYILAAFVLIAAQTLPLGRNFGGLLEPEAELRAGPIMALAPDYQLLSLVEYACVPRNALSGAPWAISGPLASAEFTSGPWSSFPARYAVWREGVELFYTSLDEDDEDVWQADEYLEQDGESDSEAAELNATELDAAELDAAESDEYEADADEG